MATVPKITLDTNCLINLFDTSSPTATSVGELEAIVKYAMAQKADLAVTTRAESDLLKDKDEVRRAGLLRRLRMFPVVGTVGRWDVSKWDSDPWGDDRTARLNEEIQQILSPGLGKDDPRYSNKVNDVDHLVGHYLNGRDIFVTDDRDILRRGDALKTSPGIVVMSPAECATYLDAVASRPDKPARPLDSAPEGYRSSAHAGTVTFDYSNNDGRFQIGEGIFAFETKWSKASNNAIHAYSDPPSIAAIALARGVERIDDVGDATRFDYSSRSRTPRIGDAVIWRNANGMYAATRIVGIKDDTRGNDRDELVFEHKILADGRSDFGST